MNKLTTKELRRLLNEYTGGQLFNKTEAEMRKYIEEKCSEDCWHFKDWRRPWEIDE